MHSVLGLLLFAAANAQSKHKSDYTSDYSSTPIVSLEKSYKFAVESVVLVKDLGCYTLTAGVKSLLATAGEQNAKNIQDTYDDATKRWEMFRTQYGLPVCDDLKYQAKAKMDSAIDFLVFVNAKVNELSKPVQIHLTAFLNRFSAAVPGSASVAPGLLDRLFTFFYLFLVLRMVFKVFCCLFCLPCKLFNLCGGRKKSQHEPKRAGRYSKDKKKN